MSRTAYRTCPLCEATCGLEITIEDEQVKVIRGDQEDPFSRGFICPKGSTLGRLRDDPDRLRTPLIKRDGVHVEAGQLGAHGELHAHCTTAPAGRSLLLKARLVRNAATRADT